MSFSSHILVILSAWLLLTQTVSCVQKSKDSERSSFSSAGESSESGDTEGGDSPTATEGAAVPLMTVSTPSTVAEDLTLNWTTPTDEATYTYVAKLCRESDCLTNCLPEVEIEGAFTTTFTGLIKGRSYYGCVFGRGADGEVTETFATASAVVIDKTIPTDIVIALPENYNTTGSLTVGWTGGTDENFDHFVAKACESNDCTSNCLDALTVSSTNAEFTGLANHKSYYYCVQSVDKAGHETIFFPSSYPTKVNTVTVGTIADRVIENQNAVTAGVAMIEIDAINSDSSDDTDVTYSCVYDILVDGSVIGDTPCSSLSGAATFAADSGVFNWTPSVESNTTYEIKIKGTHSTGVFDEEIFVIQIIQNITTTDLLQYFEAAYGNGTSLPSNPEATWLDLSGNKRNASIVGNAANGWTGTGSRSKPYRLYLDGNSRIDLGPFVATGGSFGLDTWIRPLAAEATNRTIITTGADIGNGFALKQSSKNPNRLQLIVGNYDDLILSNQGPFAYYKLDETEGTVILDSANARNLEFGTGGSIAGEGATAGIDAGGISAGVVHEDIVGPGAPVDFNLMGLSFLIKFPNDLDGSFTRAEPLFSSNIAADTFHIRMDVDEANCTGEMLAIVDTVDVTKITCVTAQTLSGGQWHHMGFRWTGSKYKVFVDGVEWPTVSGVKCKRWV